ncbi:MAG: hypothetical protein GY853_13370 [PVC group bacterium]|nr:hypothetical protein [PVC group bacterium]
MITDADIQEFMVDGRWECTMCGACCKIFNCKLLTDMNTCSIYETRPELCKTENFNRTDIERARACFMLKEFINVGR